MSPSSESAALSDSRFHSRARPTPSAVSILVPAAFAATATTPSPARCPAWNAATRRPSATLQKRTRPSACPTTKHSDGAFPDDADSFPPDDDARRKAAASSSPSSRRDSSRLRKNAQHSAARSVARKDLEPGGAFAFALLASTEPPSEDLVASASSVSLCRSAPFSFHTSTTPSASPVASADPSALVATHSASAACLLATRFGRAPDAPDCVPTLARARDDPEELPGSSSHVVSALFHPTATNFMCPPPDSEPAVTRCATEVTRFAPLGSGACSGASVPARSPLVKFQRCTRPSLAPMTSRRPAASTAPAVTLGPRRSSSESDASESFPAASSSSSPRGRPPASSSPPPSAAPSNRNAHSPSSTRHATARPPASAVTTRLYGRENPATFTAWLCPTATRTASSASAQVFGCTPPDTSCRRLASNVRRPSRSSGWYVCASRNVCAHRYVRTSHTRIVFETSSVSTWCSSGTVRMSQTVWSWPRSVAEGPLESGVQTRTTRSSPPVKTHRVDAQNATAWIAFTCGFDVWAFGPNVLKHEPVARSVRRRQQSAPPEATNPGVPGASPASHRASACTHPSWIFLRHRR